MKSRIDEAERLFKSGYNCSQAVFVTYADLFQIDRDTAMKLSSPFGAGFGKLREVCGAVSGMTMLSGLATGTTDAADREGKIANYHMVQEMAEAFREKEGTIICRELLNLKPGEDLAEPSVRTEEYYNSRPCVRLVRTAAEIIESVILKEEFE